MVKNDVFILKFLFLSFMFMSMFLFTFVGFQTRDVRCFLTKDNSTVSDDACDFLNKPPSSQECNTQACDPK